ncbi:MAG: hypothetical protein FJ194_02715 [Gammaproteobacteria bacterium]|nr:hypothetical protein [Gammaproteobacteria bacterium]
MQTTARLSTWTVAALSALLGVLVATLVLEFGYRSAPQITMTGFAAGVALAAPAVVTLYSERAVRPKFCDDEHYRRWCSSRIETEAGRRERALGSGVILRRDG